jgi:hypothetical protein
MFSSVELLSLQAKVRGFQAQGTTVRQHISRSHGTKKCDLWQLKRSLGNNAREHLVAYCLLRGVPYEKVEKCPKTLPDAKRVLNIMQEHASYAERRKLTLEKVENLLKPIQTS